jgi:uncharacterized protein
MARILRELRSLSCAALHAAMDEIGLEAPETPGPLNLFMNIPLHADGVLSFDPPVSTPGSFSACPQDILPINGRDLMSTRSARADQSGGPC